MLFIRSLFFAVILLLTLNLARAQQGIAALLQEHADAGGVLRKLSIAGFGGSGQTSIQGLATDSSGNIFVAGTTNAPDFPVKNAAQPVLADTTILRTSDLGVTWTHVGSPPGVISALVPDPVAPQILLAGTNFGIFKSSDGGQAWRLVYAFQPNLQFGGFQFNGALVIDPGNHLRLAAAGTNYSSGTLIRSLDGGETWSSGCPIPAGCGGQLIADPNGTGVLVMIADTLYLSRDWGLTFNPSNPPAMGGLLTAAMVPSRPGWIYATGAAGTLGNLSLSTDYGATWTVKANPPTNFSAIYNLAADPDQPNVLVAATVGGLFKSTDNASSWTLQGSLSSVGVGMQSIFALVSHKCNPAGGLFAIVSGRGYYQVAFSPDDGVTFEAPHLSHAVGVVTGPNCVAYTFHQAEVSSDAFIAKLAPDGSTLWATFLGGSDQDTAIALALDAQGNAYVTGNTISPDFPSTVPRIGVEGASSVFITKYSTDGKLIYSAMIGGEAANSVTAIAVDLSQNAYLIGQTGSPSFPVTAGALVTTLDSANFAGFLLKLSTRATVIYATFGAPAGALLVGADDQAILAGSGPAPGLPQGTPADFVVKLDATGSHVVRGAYIQGTGSGGPSALGLDPSGNLVVLGSTQGTTFPITPGAYISRNSSACETSSGIYVTKLRAADWNPIYSAFLRCGGQPGAIDVDSTGAVVLAASADVAGFPLHNPLLAGPTCPNYYIFIGNVYGNSAAIARLSPDGSTLEFATYVDTCGVPPIALARDGSMYVGVANNDYIRRGQSNAAGVLHMNATNPHAISLDQISNAFSGDSSAVVGGGLYSLSVSGFHPPAVDLRINPTQDLPLELSGVEVTFDGVSAAILRTSPGQIIVAPPWILPAQTSTHHVPPARPLNAETRFTSVQLSYNSVLSNATWMPVANQLPGLLARNFPVLSSSNFPDGNVRNQDGTQNDAKHPAAAGSRITVFVTGMGVTEPWPAPGWIATSKMLASVMPIYSSWADIVDTDIFTTYPPLTVYSVPGFVSALFEIPIQVPNSIQLLGGTDVGNGVQRVPLSLTTYAPPVEGYVPSPASNGIFVYLK